MSEEPTPVPSLRERIDRLDGEILARLAERRQASLEVARRKDRTRADIRDTEREEDLLVELIRRGRERGLDAHFVTRVYHEILDDSVRLQQRFVQERSQAGPGEGVVVKVACIGQEGSYSHLAARQHFASLGDRLRSVGCRSFGDILQAVENGQADFGLLPIENTTSGSINDVYDLLLHTRLHLVGETKLRVRHCLAGVAEVPLHRIRRVLSHPQALAQCGRFLRELDECKLEVERDTATAARKVIEDGDPTQAAIASEEAVRAYGLMLLRRDIADHPDNTTRFVVAGRERLRVDPRVPSKTSLVMATGQRAGALVDALLVFREADLAMTKLESRPIPENPFEELFYVDVVGAAEDPKVAEAIEQLRRVTRFVRVLGSYPSEDLEPTRPSTAKLAAEATRQGEESGTTQETEARSTAAAASASSTSRVVQVGPLEFGAGPPVVLVEPTGDPRGKDLVDLARHAHDHGAHVLLDGPSPDDPAARRARRSEYANAARAHGLALALRLESADELAEVRGLADLLRIPASRMHDAALLEAVGRSLVPILLERAPGATLDAWVQAAARLRAAGNQEVVLAETGGSDPPLDLVQLARLPRREGIPFVADPSRWAEDREDIGALARTLRGADVAGLVLRLDPGRAPSDAIAVGWAEYPALLREVFRG